MTICLAAKGQEGGGGLGQWEWKLALVMVCLADVIHVKASRPHVCPGVGDVDPYACMHAYKYSEDSSLFVFIITLQLESVRHLQNSHIHLHLLLSNCYTFIVHCVKVKAKPIFYNMTYLQEKQDIQRGKNPG